MSKDEKASVSQADWKYNPDTKKLTFSTGTISLPSGEKLDVKDGRLLVTAKEIVVSDNGVLESAIDAGVSEASAGDNKEATVEIVDWVRPSERVTVWWQVLAYLILTVAEILISVTAWNSHSLRPRRR